MKRSHISSRLDDELYRNAEKLASEIGVPLTTVILLQLKQFVRSRELHLDLLPRLNPEVEYALNEMYTGYEKNIRPEYLTPRHVILELRKLCK